MDEQKVRKVVPLDKYYRDSGLDYSAHVQIHLGVPYRLCTQTEYPTCMWEQKQYALLFTE